MYGLKAVGGLTPPGLSWLMLGVFPSREAKLRGLPGGFGGAEQGPADGTPSCLYSGGVEEDSELMEWFPMEGGLMGWSPFSLPPLAMLEYFL